MNQILGTTLLILCLGYLPMLGYETYVAAKAAINHPDNEVGDEA
jgi:hypothetical protein